MSRLIHSLPTWLSGPRMNNGKFGGGNPGKGKKRVVERCTATMRLSKKLLKEGVIQEPILTSHHTLHELQSEAVPEHNVPGAISFDQLYDGIQAGRYPQVNALTAPAFGPRANVDKRCILGSEPAAQQAAVLHAEVQRFAKILLDGKLGLGRAIWWPAFDAFVVNKIPADMLVSNDLIPETPEWKKIVDFWVLRLQNGGTCHIEYKHGDPGLDLVCTVQLAIRLCNEINAQLGRKAMLINIEFAHALGTGESVFNSMKMIMDASLFDGFCHGNSGQKLPVKFHDLLKNPIHPLELPVLMDWDFILGYGSPAVVADQQDTFRLLREWSAKTGLPVVCEHDIHYFSDNPFDNGEASIRAAEEMWAAAA